MIGYLRGRVVRAADDQVVIEAGGVGYLVNIPVTVRERMRVDEEAELHVHTHVREDQIALYGFTSLEELELFQLLIQVDGVGPRVGLAILGAASVEVLKRAILAEEVAPIRRAPGVGARTAQKVIIDLKPRLEAAAPLALGPAEGVGDGEVARQVEAALRGLGFSALEARQGVAAVDWAERPSAEAALAAALKALGR
ncbi:MAG TPA: Holliday junction branch migration protein RuvA [Candidatus Dormibacteraeota bacterium]|nr:Holliday junction branch migration protein RuvA [Candidatus Dormibacteraeota bacterium]